MKTTALTRLFALTALTGALLAACSSSSSSTATTCDQAPFTCPSGQVCWPQTATTFACLNSGSGKKGDTCMSIVDAPACGDGLACFQTAQGTPGACVSYCDPSNTAHACATGETCSPVTFQGVIVHLCIGPTQTMLDGGTDAMTDAGHDALENDTGSDAGTDSGADTGDDGGDGGDDGGDGATE